MLALFAVVVVFLGVMPALLYLVGWAAKRYTDQTPVWADQLRPLPLPRRESVAEAPATLGE